MILHKIRARCAHHLIRWISRRCNSTNFAGEITNDFKTASAARFGNSGKLTTVSTETGTFRHKCTV